MDKCFICKRGLAATHATVSFMLPSHLTKAQRESALNGLPERIDMCEECTDMLMLFAKAKVSEN